MDKSPDAFRTISEVADLLDTPAHVLRFWENRFAQVRPVKRAGGRRYYRPSDVALLAGIRTLLHDQGVTIRGVQKILRERGVRQVAQIGAAVLSGMPVPHIAVPDEDRSEAADPAGDAVDAPPEAAGPQADAPEAAPAPAAPPPTAPARRPPPDGGAVIHDLFARFGRESWADPAPTGPPPDEAPATGTAAAEARPDALAPPETMAGSRAERAPARGEETDAAEPAPTDALPAGAAGAAMTEPAEDAADAAPQPAHDPAGDAEAAPMAVRLRALAPGSLGDADALRALAARLAALRARMAGG